MIEPGPLFKLCLHCGSRYDPTDEDEERRYRRMCIGCAEFFRNQDLDDELVIEAEDRIERRARA